MKKALFILLILSFSFANAQEEQIKNTIHTFFEGLHNGDTALITKTIHKDLKLQTTFVNKEGENILRNELKDDFLKSIANKNKEDIWLEKLLYFEINIDGNLAAVWTPYEFYVNGSFSHCGANSFQLFNNNGNWEIIFLVDTRRRQGCEIKE
jgi:hypothetical protein